MPEIGVIKAKLLNDEEKRQLQSELVAANAILRSVTPDVLILRNDFKAGRILLNDHPEAIAALRTLISLETKVVQGYILTADKLCRAFNIAHERPGVTYGDYMQMAAIAIYDAQYTYDGESKLCTYVYSVIKRRLIDFIRQENRRSRPKRRVSEPEKVFERTLAPEEKAPDELDIDALMDQAGLDKLQRELIAAQLRGDRAFRKEYVCPDTGKKFTRSWLSQVYQKACVKMRAVYNTPARQAA